MIQMWQRYSLFPTNRAISSRRTWFLKGNRYISSHFSLSLDQLNILDTVFEGHLSVIGVDGAGKSVCAAEKVLQHIHGDFNCTLHGNRKNRFLILTSDLKPSKMMKYLEERTTFYQLERQGHGAFPITTWCQQSLEELGYNKGVIGMDKIAALMMHHVQRIPLTRFKAGFSSSLRQKKAIFDLMALFRQLEIQGIQPEQYEQYLVSSQEEIVAELKELPETYRMYRELLEANQVTSWHGIVLDTLSLMQSDPYFTQNLLEGYTDVVVDELQVMTPAMIKVLSHVLTHKSIERSISFTTGSFQASGELKCHREAQLSRLLQESTRKRQIDRQYWNLNLRASHNGINEIARHLMHSSKDFIPEDKDFIESLKFSTCEDEEKGIATYLKEHLMQNATSSREKSIAVVCPNPSDVVRISTTLKAQGLPVQARVSRLPPMEQPGVGTLFSMLVALAHPSETRHMYNVLRSSLFDFPSNWLSKLMEMQLKRHSSLLQMLKEFVNTNVQDQEDASSSFESDRQKALQAAIKFLKVWDVMQKIVHKKSTQELVHVFLEETDTLEKLLDPMTPEDEEESFNIAEFLRELETIEEIVGTSQLPLVLPYLLRLKEIAHRRALDTEVINENESIENGRNTQNIRVAALSWHGLHSLEADTIVFMSMSDRKFPGRLKRLTLPFPNELMQEPLPIQTRADYLEKCERLAAHAIQKAKQHIVISYAQTYTTSSSTTRPDKLSQIFQPIYVDQGDAVTYEPLTIDAKHAPTRVQSFDSYEPDHISFTQISEYLRCPHRYYLSRVLNLPSEPSPAMIYGRSLHEGIAIGGFARQENRKDICAVQEEALKAYTKAWQSGVFESKKQEFDLFSKGKNVLQKFVEQDMQAKDDDPVVKMVEMSFDLFVPEVDMTLRGVWDRIEEDHDGAKHILEYKSNMSGLDRDVKKLARESLQLKLYLFAYHCIFQEKPRGAVLQMIEDPKRITNGLHINQLDGFVPYNEEKDKTQVLEVMTKVTQGLRKGNFHPVPNYLECALCPFRNSACNHSA